MTEYDVTYRQLDWPQAQAVTAALNALDECDDIGIVLEALAELGGESSADKGRLYALASRPEP